MIFVVLYIYVMIFDLCKVLIFHIYLIVYFCFSVFKGNAGCGQIRW